MIVGSWTNDLANFVRELTQVARNPKLKQEMMRNQGSASSLYRSRT